MTSIGRGCAPEAITKSTSAWLFKASRAQKYNSGSRSGGAQAKSSWARVGKVYLQTVIDFHSRLAFGRLYTSKMPVTAVHVLNTDVLPFFEQEGVLETILSDNGREFCGRPDQHPYELFLQLEGIEHRTTKVRRPQSNGIVERLNRTLLDEHFRIVGRKKWYETVEEMQKDLDAYFQIYNYSRPHQGRNMNGRTP